MVNKNVFYPNVTSVPVKEKNLNKTSSIKKSEVDFEKVFNREIEKGTELNSVKNELKFSQHATRRLKERSIPMSDELLHKVSIAVDKAAAKGLDDTLVLTNDSALIVNAKNKTVVTAMDRSQLEGNVFTNIDGAIIV
ncbi:MAG: hypothetical protein CL678_18280 [Bdellovibrionaceae bacterium]|nr:hypothetical protein [Pseudobdellovibrionaceae bacterium]|tara:strand:- start:1302 stop:1712 length:411 start_codon:yes stop_codon:yes gene_type:complete